MKDSRAALRYAKAILDLAKDSKIESKVNEDMLLVASTIVENHDLEVMLKSPIIKAKAKQNVLNTLFENKVNELKELESRFDDLRHINLDALEQAQDAAAEKEADAATEEE